MFRMLVLQALNNLSDEQVEYQVRDRLSFSHFLGLAIEDSIPDSTTLWLFREKLAKAGLIEKLFDCFDQHLAAKGYMARGAQIIDAIPRQEPDTRSHRACVRSAAERAGRSDRANDRHGAGARQDRLAEPGLQHSPPGDARTARRGMKVLESSAMFLRGSGLKKGSREDGKSI